MLLALQHRWRGRANRRKSPSDRESGSATSKSLCQIAGEMGLQGDARFGITVETVFSMLDGLSHAKPSFLQGQTIILLYC